jgi:hypothetical protein
LRLNATIRILRAAPFARAWGSSMKNLIFGLTASVLCAGLIAQPANAQSPAQPRPATLVHADGGVVQVQGAAVPLDQSVGADAGETINVRNGQATVTFNNGCAVKIAGREYTIPAQAPTCSTGVIPAESDTKLVMLGLGGAVAVGLAVGGGGGSGSKDRPSSP